MRLYRETSNNTASLHLPWQGANTKRETGRDVYGPTHHSRLKYQTAHVLTAPLLCATASLTLLPLPHVQNPLETACCCAPAFHTNPRFFGTLLYIKPMAVS